MGLLDDAIREHLELKRRRGADPGEVARQEREALEPQAPPRDDSEEDELAGADGEEDFDAPEEPAGQHPDEVRHSAQPVDLSPGGQETVEIDMRSVLEAADEPAPAARAPMPPAAAAEEPAFDWETPGGESEEPPAEIPGQERLTFE